MPYIEDVFTEDADNEFDPEADILEMFDLPGTQAGGGETFSLQNGEAALVYLIEWGKARSFLRKVLGFAYADNASPYQLRRENPAFHPRFGWLTASTVHFSGVAPKANPDTGVPANAPNYPAMYVEPGALQKTGYYQKVYATVRFTDRMWTFRPDEFVTSYTDELARNCYFDPVPTVEMIQAEGGTAQLKWNQTGPGLEGPPTTGAESVIANLFGTLISKTTFTLNWMWVAESYLSNDPNVFFPRNVINCAGKVNSKKFGKFPAGTLLCQAPKMQRFRFPVGTYDGLKPFYGWNLAIPLQYFNPDRGVNPDVDGVDPAPDDDTIPRGHRLMPWKKTLKWYEGVRESLVDGKVVHLLPEVDLNDMFRHVDQPA